METTQNKCEHYKVYADSILTTYPAQHPWICRKCGAVGVDLGAAPERETYAEIKRRFQTYDTLKGAIGEVSSIGELNTSTVSICDDVANSAKRIDGLEVWSESVDQEIAALDRDMYTENTANRAWHNSLSCRCRDLEQEQASARGRVAAWGRYLDERLDAQKTAIGACLISIVLILVNIVLNVIGVI